MTCRGCSSLSAEVAALRQTVETVRQLARARDDQRTEDAVNSLACRLDWDMSEKVAQLQEQNERLRKTISELRGKVDAALEDRGLAMQAFPGSSETSDWVVWLWADDDPALGTFVGEGTGFEQAFQNAINEWDGRKPSEPPS